MASFRDRPTADLIVLFLTGLIGVVVIGVMIATVVLEANGREAGDGITWIGRIINTLIGAIFGYLAGRTVVPLNGNGKKTDKETS